jgi:hypothetical protein
MKTLIAQAVGVFLVMALCFSFGYSVSNSRAAKETLKQQVTHLNAVETIREETQSELNELAAQWHSKVADSTAEADRTIAGLRATGVRLRVQLADATVCGVTGDCGPEPDGKAELHPGASQFLVRQAQRADAQVEALQATIHKLQAAPKE